MRKCMGRRTQAHFEPACGVPCGKQRFYPTKRAFRLLLHLYVYTYIHIHIDLKHMFGDNFGVVGDNHFYTPT